MLLVCLLSPQVQAQLQVELGMQQQRWLEDHGEFVRESGWLPRAGLAYLSPAQADVGGLVSASVYAGDVAYRGVNQNTHATVNSHSHYQGLELQLEGWRRLATSWRARFGAELSRWRRDIYNPLWAKDQSEIYRLLQLQAGVSYAPLPRVELAADLNYPVWARVEARLGEFGFERSPVLQPSGRLSPGLGATWLLDDDLRLRLHWSRLRFAASAAENVGAALVHQPASQRDSAYLVITKIF